MSAHESDPLLRNPFSAMAVASLADSGETGDDITIDTDAIRRATGHVRGYLLSQPPRPRARPDGNVLLILGDYGTGKTHLAGRLVRVAAETMHDPSRSLHIEATAENPLRMYQRFAHKLGLDRVRARINDYYADIVAAQLHQSGIAAQAADVLRDPDRRPGEVIEPLQLMESALLREVQRTLQDVTDNADFGKALTLLLRPGFDDAVWSWLTGAEPTPVLVDRGITEAISATPDVFEAMGVLALLFGGRERRLVLIIDEFDKIFAAAGDDTGSVLAAFRKMLEVFTKAGACLVLCGHPDFVGTLDPSAVERVTHSVELAGLSEGQVRELIEQAQAPERRLAPFTVPTVGYLVALTGGNARKVIRMCHRLFQLSWDAGQTDITADMVRMVARELLRSLSSQEIGSRASRELDAIGWSYVRDHHFGEHGRADFWIPLDGDSTGCAVLIRESLLTRDEINEVSQRLTTLRAATPSVRVVLVVNGVIGPNLVEPLREQLPNEPLVYVERDFGKDFRALIGAAMGGLRGDASADPDLDMRRRIDHLNVQQSNIHGFIEKLTDHVDNVGWSADLQLTLIQKTLSALNSKVAELAGTESGDVLVRSPLPPEVDRLFGDAVAVLEDITQFRQMFDESIASGTEDMLRAVQRRLRVQDFLQAAGVATLMLKAVRGFTEAVRTWYLPEEVTGAGGELSPPAERALDEICWAYDATTEYLPLFMLDPLVALSPWKARSGKIDDLGKVSRRTRVQDALDNLSPRVRRAVLRSFLYTES
ncbi:hypothetical protein [Actinocrispum wychmicini]|uniref:Uncharacterized protein n=1 Tax=Actinocrispum wychmicini TaxID=1213861 RepID=A0A4R2JH73_9PSEU|nr:hypothetical protein [Actinocrispum wychmicini]TCO53515.1 hypothetical protein EV192_110104 [Actinocrispum wychmicini]